MKGSFRNFLESYNIKEKEIIWREKSNQFRDFWNNRILNNQVIGLEEWRIDEIIKILDNKAKGNTKESEAVAMAMIPQGVWRKMFNEIKEDNELKKLLNRIFLSNEEEIINSINELYSFNEEKKNSLTGNSVSAINSMNFAFNPEKYLSVVSLNDRKKIIDFFEIFGGPDFEEDSPGKKVFLSNSAIIKFFREILGENLSPRTLCDFLYGSLKSYWKNIPDYQSIMLPLLEFARNNGEHTIGEAINYISDFFQLTEKERREMLPSGYDKIINNRVAWARTYLKKAGLLKDPKRGYFEITERGLEVLSQNLPFINVKFLRKFPEFADFQSPKETEQIEEIEDEEELTPKEMIEKGYALINKNLKQNLLDKLRADSPEFFERIVLDLLVKMGYGKGESTGGPGDGGIDGIIYRDALKFDKIILQAKRYSEGNIITPNMIKIFIGTLDTNRIDKGVFITSSTFHKDVDDIIKLTNKNIILIDGGRLVELMIEYGLGINVTNTYPIKEIDTDYFEEE